MKKKVMILIAATMALVVGFGAFSVFASYDGYDTYKEAMKKTHTLSNVTITMNVRVSSFNEMLQDVNAVMKYDSEIGIAEGSFDFKTPFDHIEMKGLIKEDQVFLQHTGDETLYMTELEKKGAHSEKAEKFHSPEMMKIGEMIFDTLTKPMHNHFNLENNRITVDMTNDDIPTVIGAIGSYMMKKGFEYHSDVELSKDDYPFLQNNIAYEMPNLVDNITIEKAVIDAELTDEGYFKNHNMEVVISGIDDNGERQQIKVQSELLIEDINQTTPEMIDINKEDAQFFERKQVHHFH